MSQTLFDFECPNIIIHDKLDSSSGELKKLLKTKQVKNNVIVWAKEQTDGYGRYGKNWNSSGKGNLSFSFVIENNRATELVAIYPFIAALAIKDALDVFLTKEQSKKLSFKWPNDILFDGKKIGGIILESDIQGNQISNIICGIGINIVSSPRGLEFATSLSDVGVNNIDIRKLLHYIVTSFEQYLNIAEINGDQEIYDLWLKYAHNLNQEIIVISNQEETKGIFQGIENGNLIVSQEGQDNKIFFTGDVFFSEEEKITTAT